MTPPAAQLKAVIVEIEELEREDVTLAGCEEEYANLLREKSEWLKNAGLPESEELQGSTKDFPSSTGSLTR